jgi:glycosyltransferase involved in cell wall biosynthesis
MVERGHSATVLAPSFQGLPSHTIDGIPVHRFRYAPSRWENLTHEQGAPNKIRTPTYQLLGVPYVAMGIRAAANLARRERFDVIHAHWPFPHGPIASAAHAISGAPVVMNSHGAEYALARRKKWVRPLLRDSLNRAQCLISNSSHTAAEVKALSGRDSAIIPYGSTVQARPTPLPRNAIPRILFTGRLIQRKGVEYLIRAMRSILTSRRAILQITGDGDQRATLEQLTHSLGLSEHVEFFGFVTNSKLDELYAGCDVYVNPSIVDDHGDTEGLGLGPIEAFSHGRPVVATAVGGIPDVVKHQRTGLLVPEKDPGALANAILSVLDDPLVASALAATGLEFARREFDWDRIIDLIEDIYFEAIDQTRGLSSERFSAGAHERETSAPRLCRSERVRPMGLL